MALDLVLDGPLDVAERVQVLDFGLHAERLRAGGTDGHVRVAPQAALLHVAVVDADADEDGAQPREELCSVGGRPEIRPRDDFDERNTAAIEVEIRKPI